MKSWVVYVIKEPPGYHGYWKIGYSGDFDQRLIDFQAVWGAPLVVLLVMKYESKQQAKLVESCIHHTFLMQRIRKGRKSGEWFKPDATMRKWLKECKSLVGRGMSWPPFDWLLIVSKYLGIAPSQVAKRYYGKTANIEDRELTQLEKDLWQAYQKDRADELKRRESA